MTSRFGSGTVAASRRMTASPPFMSQVPRPCSSVAVAAGAGRLSLTGTVSRWPAITTRSPRPRSVRATTVLPCRLTVRWSYAAQRRLDGVRDRLLVAADRLDVDELHGQVDRVGGEVEAARQSSGAESTSPPRRTPPAWRATSGCRWRCPRARTASGMPSWTSSTSVPPSTSRERPKVIVISPGRGRGRRSRTRSPRRPARPGPAARSGRRRCRWRPRSCRPVVGRGRSARPGTGRPRAAPTRSTSAVMSSGTRQVSTARGSSRAAYTALAGRSDQLVSRSGCTCRHCRN